MKNFVFFGDEVMAGPTGFADLLACMLTAQFPAASFAVAVHGGDALTTRTALRDAPLHLIGSAPDIVVLGIGGHDLLDGSPLNEMESRLEALIELLRQKTHAQIWLTSLCTAFFPEEDGQNDGVCLWNGVLNRLADGNRVQVLDLDAPSKNFLYKHHHGSGEKRSLHSRWNRLTLFGRYLLAREALGQIPWQALLESREA